MSVDVILNDCRGPYRECTWSLESHAGGGGGSRPQFMKSRSEYWCLESNKAKERECLKGLVVDKIIDCY